MPDSLAAATVFALLIVPGYSFLAGYRLGRSHTRPERDLYAVAEAVIASIVILSLAWLWVEDLLRWVGEGTLSDHSGGVVLLLLGLIGGPFAIGRILAAAITWAGDKKWTEPPLRFPGALDGNAWQEAPTG